jgi:predicted dehydrogenase
MGVKAMKQNTNQHPTRRTFLKTAAASVTLVSSAAVRGSTANSKIEFGILGSGGRGNFVTRKFMDNAGNDIKVVAAQDPFADRLQVMQDRYDIPKNRCYPGLDAHHALIESGVDAVAVTSPPYFHADQVEAAVKANKHVWMAKPVAPDTNGCLRILECAKKVEGKLNFLIDFQTRNSPNFKECIRRVHDGDIGDLVLGQCYYLAGRLGVQSKPGMSEDEARLRNWVFDIKLSGDIIVEQNVHVIDVANWYIGAHPLRAYGTGGRKARTDVGDCWDHFICTFWYPGDVKIDFCSGQYLKGYDDLCVRMYGSKGTAESHYCGANWGQGPVRITGDNPWPGVERDNTWDSGIDNNVKDFVNGIRSGNVVNHGKDAVESTLTGVLGRMAAYEGREVTWEEMIKKNEKFEVSLKL